MLWNGRDEESSVTCIACGDSLPRSHAREYDKHGDRWDRQGKEFEYLCKPCDRSLCHQPRDGLESTVTEANAGGSDRSTFLKRYASLVEDRDDSLTR